MFIISTMIVSNISCSIGVLITPKLQLMLDTIMVYLLSLHYNKRASLACAARLADTSCPPEAPFGRLEVTLVNYKGERISKYVYLGFKIDITQKNTKFVNF